LAFAIKKKIVLVGGVCFRPPITVKSHDLHAGEIRGAMGEIVSYHEKDWFSPFFWFFVRPLAFLWPSFFASLVMIPAINLLLDFCGKFFITICLRYLKVDGFCHFLIVCYFISLHLLHF
jgi:hypothetical protein